MKRTGVIRALVCVWCIICRHKLELLKVAEDVLINKERDVAGSVTFYTAFSLSLL